MFDWPRLSLTEVDVILDVGAACGNFLAPACRYFRPKRWIAIEMLPDRCQEIRARRDLDQSIGRVIQAVVGNRAVAEVANIGRTRSPDSSSLLQINPRSSEWFVGHDFTQDFGELVDVWSLDDLLLGESRVDLVKLDVQGYEGRVISGGKRIIQGARAVIVEVLEVEHYFGQSTREEIHRELSTLGFKIVAWLNEVHSPSGELVQRDALYINSPC